MEICGGCSEEDSQKCYKFSIREQNWTSLFILVQYWIILAVVIMSCYAGGHFSAVFSSIDTVVIVAVVADFHLQSIFVYH